MRPMRSSPCPGRISTDRLPAPDIPGHDAAGADHGPVTDRDAGQDDGAAADPDVGADPHRTAEFDAAPPRHGIARMVCGINLHRGSDLGAITDHNFNDIEDDAVEIKEHAVAETDVVAVVAEKRRPDHGAAADMGETLG